MATVTCLYEVPHLGCYHRISPEHIKTSHVSERVACSSRDAITTKCMIHGKEIVGDVKAADTDLQGATGPDYIELRHKSWMSVPVSTRSISPSSGQDVVAVSSSYPTRWSAENRLPTSSGTRESGANSDHGARMPSASENLGNSDSISQGSWTIRPSWIRRGDLSYDERSRGNRNANNGGGSSSGGSDRGSGSGSRTRSAPDDGCNNIGAEIARLMKRMRPEELRELSKAASLLEKTKLEDRKKVETFVAKNEDLVQLIEDCYICMEPLLNNIGTSKFGVIAWHCRCTVARKAHSTCIFSKIDRGKASCDICSSPMMFEKSRRDGLKAIIKLYHEELFSESPNDTESDSDREVRRPRSTSSEEEEEEEEEESSREEVRITLREPSRSNHR